jgi:cholesterol transport system auxiliary component
MRRTFVNRAKQMRLGIAVVIALSLGGCFTSPASRPNVAVFDLGEVVSAPASNTLWLGALDVTAPSWLDSRAMQYRLVADPARRQSYAESRWAATPAELLAASLRRQLGGASGTGDGCRLRMELDEWVQSFDAEGNSQSQIALRAGLYTAKGDGLLARQAFSLKSPAGRDARQGVAAFVTLEQRLASDLGQWLSTLAKDQNLPARCRS